MRSLNFADIPGQQDLAVFAPGFGCKFMVTVDTEEEFDWDGPFQRTGHGVRSVPALTKFQQFCDNFGVKPVYLVDYPVISHAPAADILAGFAREGRAHVGVHLHPWVNPPHSELVTSPNSFAGNLPFEVERSKLFTLRDRIVDSIGSAPLVYRAGRYGVGPNTAQILAESGIPVDSSVRARFDYSGQEGPDFSRHPQTPYWLNRSRGLLELPLTASFWGFLRQQGDLLYPKIHPHPTVRGAMSKLSMLERIPLTPEGVSAEDAIKGIDVALDDGLQLLVMSFHSPSLQPGNTSYVKDHGELDSFYDWWRTVFSYLQQRGVAPASVEDVIAGIEP